MQEYSQEYIDEYLRQHYPDEVTEYVAKALGISSNRVRLRAKKLGLQYSDKHYIAFLHDVNNRTRKKIYDPKADEFIKLHINDMKPTQIARAVGHSYNWVKDRIEELKRS